jgi:hypothetical protein
MQLLRLCRRGYQAELHRRGRLGADDAASALPTAHCPCSSCLPLLHRASQQIQGHLAAPSASPTGQPLGSLPGASQVGGMPHGAPGQPPTAPPGPLPANAAAMTDPVTAAAAAAAAAPAAGKQSLKDPGGAAAGECWGGMGGHGCSWLAGAGDGVNRVGHVLLCVHVCPGCIMAEVGNDQWDCKTHQGVKRQTGTDGLWQRQRMTGTKRSIVRTQ